MRRSLLSPCLVVLSLAAPALGAGLTPRLVKDINPLPESASSLPSAYVTVGDVTYFTAADGDTGRELWRTDGSAGGTYRLTDACAGPCSSNPEFFAAGGRSYFFRARDEGGKTSLWVSQGTPATTLKLLAIPALGESRWVPALGALLFTADNHVDGPELWRSDGTPAGTYEVADLLPGPPGSNPRQMAVFQGRLFFVADDAKNGPVIWRSDGTAAGTGIVRDPAPGITDPPSSLRVAGNALYFVAPTLTHGAELWRSDGTARGTRPLIDLTPGAGSPAFWDFVPLGSRLLFVADDGTSGQQLWATDGTRSGTRKLTQFARADAFHSPGFDLPLAANVVGGRLAFVADDGVHGQELWATDGTAAGTVLLKDVCPGPCSGSSLPGMPTLAGDRLLFYGSDPTRGTEPWVTDGTAGGTVLLKDICAGGCSSYASFYPAAAGTKAAQAFFTAAASPDEPAQVWRTDGTAAGTQRLTDVRSLDGYLGEGYGGAVLGNGLVFSALEDPWGDEPWHSDGTPQGTGLLADVDSRNVGGSFPRDLTAVGSTLFFFAADGVRNGLWKSDGTAAGTVLVRDLTDAAPSALWKPGPTAKARGWLFVTLRKDGGEHALWRSDGTAAGTVRLTPDGFQGAEDPVGVGDLVFFTATDGQRGTELWKSDGTVAGTGPVLDLEPGAAGSQPRNLTAFQGRLFFVATTSAGGSELWLSDGTETGTRQAAPGVGLANPARLAVAGDRLWLLAAPDGAPSRIWASDGTAAGTAPADLVPDAGFTPDALGSDGARLLISGRDTAGDPELWLSAAAAPARRLGALRLTPDAKPASSGGMLYFVGSDAAHGSALWRSDGTEAGTAPVADPVGRAPVLPGPPRVFGGAVLCVDGNGALWQSGGTAASTSTLPERVASRLAVAGSHLFFSGYDRSTGTELWAIDAP